jgi:DNA-binding HxlR family transcriptional regulator
MLGFFMALPFLAELEVWAAAGRPTASVFAAILTERWTPLVLPELFLGSHHFNQLRRGIPQMSR